MNKKITIIGAGLSGITISKLLKSKGVSYDLFDKTSKVGGACGSTMLNGNTFDLGIHCLYTKSPKVLEFFNSAINNDYVNPIAVIYDYVNGTLLKHPAIFNLKGLQEKTANNIKCDILKRDNSYLNINSFADWSNYNYGETYSSIFQLPYTEKFWATNPEKLSTKWIEHRLKVPSYEDVENGITSTNNEIHYVKRFYYPQNGGFVKYIQSLAEEIDIQHSKEVVKILTKENILIFRNGDKKKFSKLISTIPLPELIPMIDDVPENVLIAANRLNHTSLYLFNFVLHRKLDKEWHCIYVGDKDIPYSRISCPTAYSPQNSPDDITTIQAEVYKAKDDTIDMRKLESEVIESMMKMNIINDASEIKYKNSIFRKYANIIYDFEREEAINIIHNFLKVRKIHYSGRYGKWDYSLVDKVVNDAYDLVDLIC